MGIAGIGVGIDYLIRSGLIEVDYDFFEDLDERISGGDVWPNLIIADEADRLRMVLALSPGECGGRDCLSPWIARRIEQDQAAFSRREWGCSSFSALMPGIRSLTPWWETDWERLRCGREW